MLLDPRFLPACGHAAGKVQRVIYVSSGYDLPAQYACEQTRSGGKSSN